MIISIEFSNCNLSAPITIFYKEEPSKIATIAARELSKPESTKSLSPLMGTSSINYTEKVLEQVLVNETGMDFIAKFSNNRSIVSLGPTRNEIAMLQLDGDYGVQCVEIWNITNQTKIRTFYPAYPDQGEAITCITYGGKSDDGVTPIVAIGTSKGNLELWNSFNGKKIAVYPASSTAPIQEIASLGTGLLAIASGTEIIIYDCISKKEIDRFEISASLTCLTYLGNNLIACGLKDQYSNVKVYNFTTHECVFTATTVPGYPNRCIAPLSEGQFLVGNEMGGIYLFDLQNLTEKNVLAYVSPSTMVKISPTQIAAGFYGGLYIVNTETWKYELASDNAGQPFGVCPSPNGPFFTASGYPISGVTRSSLAEYILSPSCKVGKEQTLSEKNLGLICRIKLNVHLLFNRFPWHLKNN